MMRRQARLAAVAVGVAAVFSMTAGVASGASTTRYVQRVDGPFASQATCSQISAEDNSPPDVLTESCYFSSTQPVSGASDPGWYFNLLVSTD